MADLPDKDSTQLVRIVGADSSGNETNYIDATADGLKVDGSAVIHPVIQSITTKATFGAAIVLTAANAATDIFSITGSATKTVSITKIGISAFRSSAETENIVFLKRSTANTGGTSTTITAVPYDSSLAAASATVRAYTANPTLGTLVGNIQVIKYHFPTDKNPTVVNTFDFGQRSRPIILSGINEVFSINLNGETISGNSFALFIEWTEE